MDANNLTFVYSAYGLTWAVLIAYALHTHATLRRARASYESTTGRAKENK